MSITYSTYISLIAFLFNGLSKKLKSSDAYMQQWTGSSFVQVMFCHLLGAEPLPDATYRQVSNISRTLVGNKIVDHSDVVGASPIGAAPTASSFST